MRGLGQSNFRLDLDSSGEKLRCAVAENHQCWLRWSRRGREARKKNAATNGGMSAWKATLRWHGAWRGGRRAKSGSGGTRADPGVRPTKTYATAPGSGRYRGTAHEDGAVR